MTISEQALFLLDIPPASSKRKKMESFFDMDSVVSASFGIEMQAPQQTQEDPVSNPFSVASRLNRSNHESHLKSEALMEALKKIRASHVSRPRSSIIRGT